jgi:2-hydroxychromene-2-carboxylate isomerase
MEARDLRLYLDFKSPYAYLVIAPARALETELGLKFTWLPYVLNLPDFIGTLEGRNDHQWRRVRYSYMDARRLANRHGLTVKGPQKLFDSSIVSIGMIYAGRRGVLEKYLDLAFERFWKRDLDIEDRHAVARVIEESGASPAAFLDFLDGVGRDELARVVRQAETDGVFGVPMFVIDGELFWGGDRLWMVREKLGAETVR